MSSTVLESTIAASTEAAPAPFELQPLAGKLGAEVRGLRLSAELAPTTFAALKQALLRHKVLFFKGQQHQAFARLFGPLVEHPTVPSRDGTQILELDSAHGGRADSWHTDVTFEVDYPQVAVLRSVVIPPTGGDTVWANTVAAYNELPSPRRACSRSRMGRVGAQSG